jgi:hypothetical protein
MQRNLIWPIFLSVISVLLVVFTSLLSIDLYQYRHLSHNAVLKEKEGAVRKLGVSKYQIEIDYSYEVQGNKFTRHQILKKKSYKNIWLANQAIDNFKENESLVWYNPREPHMGSLSNAFPYRRLFSTTILLGIFLYFCLLSRYMLKRV